VARKVRLKTVVSTRTAFHWSNFGAFIVVGCSESSSTSLSSRIAKTEAASGGPPTVKLTECCFREPPATLDVAVLLANEAGCKPTSYSTVFKMADSFTFCTRFSLLPLLVQWIFETCSLARMRSSGISSSDRSSLLLAASHIFISLFFWSDFPPAPRPPMTTTLLLISATCGINMKSFRNDTARILRCGRLGIQLLIYNRFQPDRTYSRSQEVPSIQKPIHAPPSL
jgi:hypothetical protein